jgi:hypothetical protein
MPPALTKSGYAELSITVWARVPTFVTTSESTLIYFEFTLTLPQLNEEQLSALSHLDEVRGADNALNVVTQVRHLQLVHVR